MTTGNIKHLCLRLCYLALSLFRCVYCRRILVFGGNGFMGAATVEHLLQNGETVTIVNRGNWYWDSEEIIKPHVLHFKCDRQLSLFSCEELTSYLDSNKDLYFNTVVDFSAYHQQAVTEVLSLFNGKIGRYVYISSDSVYEVCHKNHSQPSLESDAVRPVNEKERARFNLQDDYGHRKLQCEEVLEEQRKLGGVPFVSLRLPDVIGSRDNTYRWWMYQMWIRLGGYVERPLSVPRSLVNEPLSFVYSEDVAKLIVALLTTDLELFDQAYNLAFVETPTLKEVVETIKGHLNESYKTVNVDDSEEVFSLFPSVKLGPVDISKAQRLLNWKPTSFKTATMETVNFYEKAIKNTKYASARKEIIRLMQAYFTKHPHNILYGLNGVYGLQFIKSGSHDEL